MSRDRREMAPCGKMLINQREHEKDSEKQSAQRHRLRKNRRLALNEIINTRSEDINASRSAEKLLDLERLEAPDKPGKEYRE